MIKQKSYNQAGDVLLARVNKPKNTLKLEMSKRFESQKNRDLAYGEHSDHVHMLVGGDVNVYTDESTGERYVEVLDMASLEHLKMSTGSLAEHLPQTIEKGWYKFGQVQEYDPFEQVKRAVVD